MSRRAATVGAGARRRRLGALVRKESLQILRDPSSILIAFVLPVVLLILFALAISLDVEGTRIGVVLEDDGEAAETLAAALAATRFLDARFAPDRRTVVPRLLTGEFRGVVVIPPGFSAAVAAGRAPQVQVLTDGASPNTANFVAGYTEGVVRGWQAARPDPLAPAGLIALAPRFWFNAELESRSIIAPGAIAIVMTMIGTLLTALVMAREWERGTMEALMATPSGILEIVASKLLPYFVLGLAATYVCVFLVHVVLGVPFRGSLLGLTALSAAFLMPALGQGLLISAATRNQFLAAQIALFSGFLPAFMLSGFLFEIESMPPVIRALSYGVPARYFVGSLQTLFLAGDVWPEFLAAIGAMLAIGAIFFGITARRTRKRLD